MPKLAIIPAGADELDLKDLDQVTRNKLIALEERLAQRMLQVGKSYIAIGKDLSDIQDLLKPQRRFVPWIKRQGTMDPTTVYRLIGAYKRAMEVNPLLVQEAIAAGVPMFGVTKRAPFGKFGRVLHLLPDPSKPKTAEECKGWIAKAKELLRETPGENKGRSVMELLARRMANAYQHLKRKPELDAWIADLKERIQKELDKDKQRQSTSNRLE